jgi:hypothetical protein
VRSAITKVEMLGHTASGVALHPRDWEVIETAEDGVDRLYMTNGGSPVDRAARRLWGVPVALTTTVDQGSGVLVSEGSASLVADPNVAFQLGRCGDDFTKNFVRARAEGRFEVGAWQPLGIVEMALVDED